ncbi:MAG: phosphate ABC transporter substrate-binding protein [Actinobacteria bacterium]|jgi:phosphate transport system substrate-binding protein|nr:MAG: phosphate ABC transporter substrate-binding protein [Actinomycetota bacterium]
MTKKRLGLITAVSLAVALILTFAAVGCGESNDQPVEPDEPKLSGTLDLSGSTTVLPLAQEAADMFMDENPDVTVNVQGGGSSVGISNVAEGVVDIGNASRGLKDEEKGLGLEDHEIALDVIVVIVHGDVPVEDLTADQVFDIFTGKVTNWKDVGGPDQAINVVVRDEASGTREMFDEKALKKEAPLAGAIETNSNGIMRQTVSSTPFSIGYISLGYLDSSVKAVKYDGVEGSKETAVDKTYPLSRYLHMFTEGEATGLAEAFIAFVLSDNFQDEVVSEEYIPMTEI